MPHFLCVCYSPSPSLSQQESLRTALERAHKVLKHCDLSLGAAMLLCEIYLDCMVEERQRKSYASKRSKANKAAKKSEKEHMEMILSVSEVTIPELCRKSASND